MTRETQVTTVRLVLANGLEIARTVLRPLPDTLKILVAGEVETLRRANDKRGVVYRREKELD